MYLDFSRRSVGAYAIYATVTGSYGEQVYSQVGRNHDDVHKAVAEAVKRFEQGQQDVALVVRERGCIARHIPLAELAQGLGYERIRRTLHRTPDTPFTPTKRKLPQRLHWDGRTRTWSA